MRRLIWGFAGCTYHIVGNHMSTVILLPSADSFKKGCCQLQAKYVHTLLVNHLFKLALEKVWLSELTPPPPPPMTIAVDWEVKQQNKQINVPWFAWSIIYKMLAVPILGQMSKILMHWLQCVFAFWVFFHDLLVGWWLFQKSFFRKVISGALSERSSVKEFGFRSSQTLCWAWSGSKLFADDKS